MFTVMADVELSWLVVCVPHDPDQEGLGNTGTYSEVDIGPSVIITIATQNHTLALILSPVHTIRVHTILVHTIDISN